MLERTVFVLDVGGDDLSKTDIVSSVGAKPMKASRLRAIRSLAATLARCRLEVQPKHQFAVAVLGTDCVFLSEQWSSSLKRLLDELERVAVVTPSPPTCNLGSMVSALRQRVASDADSASYSYRAILFYSRTRVIPTVGLDAARSHLAELAQRGGVYIDAMCWLSDDSAASPEREALEAIKSIIQLEGRNWIFSLTPLLPRINEVTALLLLNASQRPNPQLETVIAQ